MNKKKFNLNDINKNLINIEKKIKDKNMTNNFWVIIDRADFKPLKKKNKSTLSLSRTKSKKSKSKSKSKSKKLKKSKLTSKSKSKSKSKKSKEKKSNEIVIHSINEIKTNFLNDKKEYYVNKKFACVKLLFDNKIINNLEDVKFTLYKKTHVLSVSVDIFIITDQGELNYTNSDHWNTTILLTIDDLRSCKLKLKTIEMLTRIVAETPKIKNKIYYSDLFTK